LSSILISSVGLHVSSTRSPHHLAAVFEHDVGIRFDDKERSDVAKYCIQSATWMPSAAFAA